MEKMRDYLGSPYIIDGIRLGATPIAMLRSAGGEPPREDGELEPIVDESLDPGPSQGDFSLDKAGEYLSMINATPRRLPVEHAGAYSKISVARAIIDTLWLKGHFSLDDLVVSAAWKWDMSKVGNPAAFYGSVEAVCDYLDSLGLRLKECGFAEARACSFSARATLSGDMPQDDEDSEEEEYITDYPLRKVRAKMGRSRKCPQLSSGGPQDWIIFVPFDTCNFRLGGSMLSQVAGTPGGTAPEIIDPDYFMDCFEVVRELVEDRVVTAGVTVGDGGLMNALGKMLQGRGMEADLGGIARSYGNSSLVQMLFAEVPGVIIEIKDTDYDYIDAEFLLQDVAYYPLGHPGGEGLRVASGDASDISGILRALMGDASEGED